MSVANETTSKDLFMLTRFISFYFQRAGRGTRSFSELKGSNVHTKYINPQNQLVTKRRGLADRSKSKAVRKIYLIFHNSTA
jgi:hypothetical protein